jgi:hypothetical protein
MPEETNRGISLVMNRSAAAKSQVKNDERRYTCLRLLS